MILRPSVDMQKTLFLGAMLFQCVVLLFSADLPFFWDSIQFGSRHAQFYFTHGFHWLPQAMDSGNPPLLGLLVSGSWLLAGRSLIAAHAVIWLFAVSNLALLALVGKKLAPARWGWLTVLWMANPVYAAQTTLVSPDVVLVTGILLLWVGRLESQKWIVAVGTFLLAGVSLRGLVLAGGIGIWWLLDHQHRRFVRWVIWGILPGLMYHLAHWIALDWAFLPSSSPWSAGFATQTLSQMPRYAMILVWRVIDHGNIIIWLMIGWLWLSGAKPQNTRSAAWLVVFALTLIPFFLFFSTLNMHRYLLPVFLAGTMMLAERIESNRIYTGIMVVLLSGNLWIYPDRIAQGWDATLAWLVYPHHREQVLDFMEQNDIDWENTASLFPNLGPQDEIDLNGQTRSMKDLGEEINPRYVFYSNVMNDLSDDRIKELSAWPVLFRSGEWPVRVILYQNPQHGQGGE